MLGVDFSTDCVGESTIMELSPTLVVTAVAVFAIAIFLLRGRDGRKKKTAYIEALSCELSHNGQELWRSLLGMSMGNVELAKRLVLREKSQNPGADMEILIKEAIARWRRDIGR